MFRALKDPPASPRGTIPFNHAHAVATVPSVSLRPEGLARKRQPVCLERSLACGMSLAAAPWSQLVTGRMSG